MIKPPVAARRPHSYERHGVTIDDPYHWLRDPGYPKVEDEEVLAYLREENAYFDAVMAPHAALVETLFEEMKGRIKEDDSSVPVRDGEYFYWWAFDAGAQYRKWYRRPVAGGADQLIFDEPAEAAAADYFRLGALEVSPDGRLAATMIDDDGSERFKLRIRDLASGEDIETVTEVGIGAPVWAGDSAAIVFTEVNEQWRSYRARLHRIGDAPGAATTLYEESEDKGFSVGVSRSHDRSLIFIGTGDNASTELRFVPADDPAAPPVLVRRRAADVTYSADAAHGKLWIVANDDHINFRLAEAEVADPGAWRTVIAGSDDVYIRGVSAFRDHLVIQERLHGLDQIRLRGYDGGDRRVTFPEASYTAFLGSNPEFAPAAYRIGYSSMVTPLTVYDYHPADDRLEVLKVQEVPSGYDPDGYATERLMLPTRDGKQVPVSIVYPKGFARDGTGKLYLYAYGAYGYAIPPSFSTARLSLLDRGYACAIAHIRGGDDLGYGWFLEGKAEKRTNTFRDFVDAANGLVAAGYAAPGRIAIQGGSAGGKLMGVVSNSDPHLWGAVVADVPFVDVLATMLDDTLPLTPGEWPEWGNPILDKAAFDLIRSYSPYDNVKAQDYPPMLITGGLNDPRVTYWEPAKWAAKLRAAKTDDNLLLLKINMGAGHGGKSGRWESLREVAEAYAFILTQIG
ncbi:S9 family peptidase [Allosphingosinicella indica]|uniref:Oligopeptidase B Serine peptidase. MEROPS family S09A n=1 Tax=Allosphingosinicella indica TaxID=941907 RepID=A0A1X7G0S9_9SPHN|nr:S9 family peptidase [Allosphingosinicella indica]SMF61973.1 oligopeptidase B Serine peptidase. MEROPS family S09A [Allosphingosinicella indica]